MTRAQNRFLVIMVKRAIMGRVKTRLAVDIGGAHAARFYRHTSQLVARRLGADARWTTVLAVSPDAAVHDAAWPSQCPRVPQGTGDLGARMQRVIDGFPPGPIVIIGSDCPSLSTTHIASAFQALGNQDVVFCPAPDGGYGLIGFRRRAKVVDAFETVRWSSEHALTDTLKNLNGLKIACLNEIADVDTGAEYRDADRVMGRLILPASV